MRDEHKELTPRQILQGKINNAIARYRKAVRWLREARLYKNTFSENMTSDGRVWNSSKEGEIAEDANLAYDEAVADVLYWRSRMLMLRKELGVIIHD